MYLRDTISFNQIYPAQARDFTNSVWIEINNNHGQPTVIGLVYRSPNSSRENNYRLYGCMDELSGRNLILMGDFNFPDIDWERLTSGNDGHIFLDKVMDCFLVQHVNFPTREDNILDLVLSSDQNMICNIESIGKLGSSDHILLLSDFNLHIETN